MALPTKPDIDYSYTGFAAGLGDGSFPGTQLDNDLIGLVDAISETIDFVGAVIRDDGQLQNGVVKKESLDASLVLGVAPPRPWATARAYVVDETATINNSIYICTIAHTSGVFASDLGAGFWGLIAELTVPAAISDGTVTEPKHATGGVSTRALADGSVTTVKIAAASVTTAKLASSTALALVPIGTEVDFAGFLAPFGWAFEFGQAVSRVTYIALFNVLCPNVTATTTNASPVITGIATDLRNLGLEGAPVEGANIPPGATVVSVAINSITLSLNATGNAAGVSVRILPWGVGDGSTTFNLPDARDRVSVGRGNMGGTAAGRITAAGVGNPGIETNRIGTSGGVDRHTLSTAQLAAHTHTASASTSITDPGHAHNVAFVIGADAVGSGERLQASPSTGAYISASSTTGITAATTVSVNNAGGGEAHPNVQPTRVTNKIIFTGVL
jgi:microcystin-dependent protein